MQWVSIKRKKKKGRTGTAVIRVRRRPGRGSCYGAEAERHYLEPPAVLRPSLVRANRGGFSVGRPTSKAAFGAHKRFDAPPPCTVVTRSVPRLPDANAAMCRSPPKAPKAGITSRFFNARRSQGWLCSMAKCATVSGRLPALSAIRVSTTPRTTMPRIDVAAVNFASPTRALTRGAESGFAGYQEPGESRQFADQCNASRPLVGKASFCASVSRISHSAAPAPTLGPAQISYAGSSSSGSLGHSARCLPDCHSTMYGDLIQHSVVLFYLQSGQPAGCPVEARLFLEFFGTRKKGRTQ